MLLLSRIKISLLILAVVIGLYFVLIPQTPSNEGNWQTQYRVLPTVTLSDETITVTNLRDFRYQADDRVTEARYLDQQYKISDFVAAWYGISHFGENGLAHVFMSFEFADQQYLAVSIEARLQEQHQQGYSPVKGLLRAYTKMVVLATEQDIIGLRSHVRGERVHLYKLDVPDLYTVPLMLNFLREAQVLNRQPEFYNTLLDNCMTGLLAQSHQFNTLGDWLDWRIMLPGYSDEIAYDLGIIKNDSSLESVRKKAIIDPSQFSLDDAAFSERIRSPRSSKATH